MANLCLWPVIYDPRRHIQTTGNIMSIETHPTRAGWYYVKHYPNGRKNKPERTPVEGYAAAASLDNSLKSAKGKGGGDQTTYPKIGDVVEPYLAWGRNIKKMSLVTLKAKEQRLNNYILPFFGNFRVKDLQQTLLDQYAANMKKWMYASDHAHLFALVKWMVSRKYANKLDWEPERISGNHAVKPVPHPSDLLKAIDAMKKEIHRILFKFMLYTGLRWNEARHILWEDIDHTSGSIRIKEILDGPQDIIYIPEPLKEWFRANQKGNGYVFESAKHKGQPVKNLWKVLEDASKICGTHLSTHSFRHASGTYLYEQTDDIYKVQAHLRHSKIASTQIYTRMSIKRRKDSINSVIDYIAGKN